MKIDVYLCVCVLIYERNEEVPYWCRAQCENFATERMDSLTSTTNEMMEIRRRAVEVMELL